jgi:hypothetical protein
VGTDADDAHARGESGGDAVGGVLDHDAARGILPERRGAGEKPSGSGLLRLVGRRDHDGRHQQPGSPHARSGQLGGRRRDQGVRHALVSQRGEQVGRAEDRHDALGLRGLGGEHRGVLGEVDLVRTVGQQQRHRVLALPTVDHRSVRAGSTP